MKHKTVSISLIFLFVSALALPLLAAADECDMPCCVVTVPCCETASARTECPAMVPGQDNAPVLLPVAPGPKKSEFSYPALLSSISPFTFDTGRELNGQLDRIDTQPRSHTKVPSYLLTHSLLI